MTRAFFRRGKRIDYLLQIGLPLLTAIVIGLVHGRYYSAGGAGSLR